MEVFDLFAFENNYQDGKCCFERDGNTIVMSEQDQYYEMLIEPPYPMMVCTQKLFYADTLTIMSKGEYLKYGGTKIGKWELFDRSGNVVEEMNYEEGWDCSWELLFPTLVDKGINVKSIVNINRYVEVGDDENYQTYENRDYIEMKSGERGNAEKNGEEEIYRDWIITTLIGSGLVQKHTFDGNTGNKLWSKFIKIKQG